MRAPVREILRQISLFWKAENDQNAPKKILPFFSANPAFQLT